MPDSLHPSRSSGIPAPGVEVELTEPVVMFAAGARGVMVDDDPDCLLVEMNRDEHPYPNKYDMDDRLLRVDAHQIREVSR